jgi:hypothetical protein
MKVLIDKRYSSVIHNNMTDDERFEFNEYREEVVVLIILVKFITIIV